MSMHRLGCWYGWPVLVGLDSCEFNSGTSFPMPKPSDYDDKIRSLKTKISFQKRETVCSETEISPNTLVDITDGDMPWWRPDFEKNRESTKKRTKRLWAKSICRIAAYLGEPVEQWLETCGLGLDEDGIREAVEQQTVAIAEKQGQPVMSDVLSQIRFRKNVVDTQLFVYPPFCNYEGDEHGFFGQIAARIVKSINPSFHCNISAVESLEDLLRQNECPLIVGVFDTTYRRFGGIDFQPIRGWNARLGAVVINEWSKKKESSAENKQICWADITQPTKAKQKNIRALVVENEVGALFLSSHASDYYRDDSRNPTLIFNRVLSNTSEHIERLLKLRRADPDKEYVFVADEYSCRHLVDRFNEGQFAGRDDEHYFKAQMVQGNDWEFPTYAISFATPAGGGYEASRWFRLVENALETEIYGSAYVQTAYAYGELIVGAIKEDGFRFEDIPYGARPTFFELGRASGRYSAKTKHFWQEVYKPVLDCICSLPSRTSESSKLEAFTKMLPREAPTEIVFQLLQDAVTRISKQSDFLVMLEALVDRNVLFEYQSTILQIVNELKRGDISNGNTNNKAY